MSDESARLEALLQAVPIFAALERVELARLVGALEEAHLAAREVIFEEGGESGGLYIVQSGQVHLAVRTPRGERLIREVDAGMHFGEVGLLLDRCTASATAHTAVRLRVRSETAAVLHLVIVRCVSSAFERLVRDLVAGSGATAVFVAWADRFAALREFYPLARREDWQLAACFWLVSRHRL
jgi:signal-transduction protein with cAMP-binding, CBS, and nucleotidyltransferase domain